jgi:hypothetical protein
MLAMLDPITLPSAMAGEPSSAALRLTISSGALVANDTTVRPMTILDKFSLSDSPTDALTRSSPPITKTTSPINRYNQSIELKYTGTMDHI